jgi:hypothetical protein
MKRLFRGLGVTVLAVVLGYYVGINALLASSWGERLMNGRPELFQVHYTSAWTLIPMQLEVRGFQLSMQDRSVQIMITADRVHGNLHPWTLIQQRFVATQVEAEGVTMRVRPRMAKGDPMEKYLAEFPPIAGYETAVLDVSSNEVQAKDIRPLSLEFTDLKVTHLRELWIDRMRYTGDADVSGGLQYEPLRKLAIDDGHFTDKNSKLVMIAPNELAVAHVDARVSLNEVSLSAFDFPALVGLTAHVELSASAPPSFLNDYLVNAGGLSTLSVSGAEGQLELTLDVDKGLVRDGGKLTFASKRIAVRLPVVEVWGAADVKGFAREGRLLLAVDINQAGLRRRDGEHLMTAERFSLHTNSPAELPKAIDVDAVLTLSGGKVEKLSLLNEYVPEGTGVQLAAGSGVMNGSLRLDSVPPRGRGEFDLVASDVSVQNRAATVKGKLLVSAKLKSIDLNTGAMDLSSTIAIEEATLVAQGRSWPRLWLRAVADPCVLTPNAKVLWSAKVTVGSSNLQPLLAIVSANVPLPGVLSMFTDSPNVKAEATLVVREDGVELPKLSLVSSNVRVEGAVSLREASATDPKLEPWGQVVAHLGALSAGVQLDGPKVSVVFGDLVAWAARRTN